MLCILLVVISLLGVGEVIVTHWYRHTIYLDTNVQDHPPGRDIAIT